MASESQPTVSMVTADSPQQPSQIMEQDALMRLLAVLNNIETASADNLSDVRISRSDFKLIRSLVHICVHQARIRCSLDELIQEKDEQLRSTWRQLDESQRTVTRLKRRMQTRSAEHRGTSETAGLASAAIPRLDFFTTETLPTSVEPFSSRRSLTRSSLEPDTVLDDEKMQVSHQREDGPDRIPIEQSNSGFNTKSEFAEDPGGGRKVPETGARCHVTLAHACMDKVVQQNVRLKRMLRDLIGQRHQSVEQFLVRITL